MLPNNELRVMIHHNYNFFGPWRSLYHPLSRAQVNYLICPAMWAAIRNITCHLYLLECLQSLPRFIRLALINLLHICSNTTSSLPRFGNADVPAYSDTLRTRPKCHCNQAVTVSRGNLLTNKSFGACQKCHCKWSVTENNVTVSGDVSRLSRELL